MHHTWITHARAIAALLATSLSLAAADQSYHVDRTIPVGGEGRWDYVITDQSGKRLYVTRSSHTQALDTATGAVVYDIPDTKGVHGVALAPDLDRGYISSGEDATIIIFTLSTGKVIGAVPAAADADAIIYDPSTKQVLAFCGDAKAMLSIPANADPASAKSQSLDLGGKPEYAVADGAGKVFVNINDTSELAAIDMATRTITARWPIAPGQHATGLAIDAAHRLLFIGCRNKLMVVMDADKGTVLASLPIGAGVDATAFRGDQAFASCGDGTLTVVHEESPTTFTVAQTLTTERGARTMAVDPSSDAIYLPTAEFEPAPADAPRQRPQALPGSFHIVVVRSGPAPAPK
jgi:DNA-binding beta-propeller fold protein YncE